MQTKSFNYGRYSYDYVLLKTDRKTISLIIKPDKVMIVKAPIKAKQDEIETFLKKKWSWMEKQINYFDKYDKKKYTKEHVTGESFLYLGRQYKLVVKRSKIESVELSKGILTLNTRQELRNRSHNRDILNKWYDERAKIVFLRRYEEILKLFDYDFTPVLDIRKMNKRWGSFLSHKKIYLNPELVKSPTSCIDYVIIHELCHMTHKKHDRSFYNLLTSKCQDWEKRKERLEILAIDS